MQRILVIDDDPTITAMLKRGLSYEGYVVDTAESGEQGLAIAREYSPDLIILDIMMPHIDGLEVLRRLRAVGSQPPVLLLTAKDAPADQVKGLQAGADDYVIKPFTFEVLAARVQALLRRQQPGTSTTLHFDDLTLDAATHIVRRGQRTISLTHLEFNLLHEFLNHPRQVLSKEILLDRVWNYDFSGNANIVEVYVKQLRQKLEEGGASRLIQTIRGVGYALREEE